MRGKTVVITGGTSGIGEVAAIALARMGARIVLVARDNSRAATTLSRLRGSAPGIARAVYSADLLRLVEMKRVAAQIADQEPRIDVLINNAGALFGTRRLTEDGLERTFALNDMAYFVITGGLGERLSASAPSRIINTASAAHLRATLDFDDLQSAKSFGAPNPSVGERASSIQWPGIGVAYSRQFLDVAIVRLQFFQSSDLQSFIRQSNSQTAILSGTLPMILCFSKKLLSVLVISLPSIRIH